MSCGSVRVSSFRELLEEVGRHQSSCSSYGVMGFIPLSLMNIVDNMEKIAFLKGQLLECVRLVGSKGSNDLLGRLYRVKGFRE